MESFWTSPQRQREREDWMKRNTEQRDTPLERHDKEARRPLVEETISNRDVRGHLKSGGRVYVLGAGMYGTLTRVTKAGMGWVKVKSRWGNHHHPVTAKTFRYPLDRIIPEESARGLVKDFTKRGQAADAEQRDTKGLQ